MELNRLPFETNGQIEKHGSFTDISTIKDNPNYLAKSYMLDYEQHPDDEPAHTYEERKQQFIEDARLMQTYFGDSIPEFHTVMTEAKWDKTGNTQTPLIFMKKVKSKTERDESDERKYDEGKDEIFAKEIDLFKATFDGTQGLVPEIFKTENFIYGNTDTDETPRLYFIDLYPVYRWDPKTLLDQLENRLAFFDQDQYPKTRGSLQKLKDLIKE